MQALDEPRADDLGEDGEAGGDAITAAPGCATASGVGADIGEGEVIGGLPGE